MKSLLTTSPLDEAKELVKTLTTTKDDLTSRCQILEAQQTAQAELVNELEARRTEIIESISHGSGSDSDLAKLRKELTAAKDKLADADEVLAITQSRLDGVGRELEQAKFSINDEQRRARRAAVDALIETHRSQIQLILNEIYVASCSHQEPGSFMTFWAMLPMLGLKVPQEDDFFSIKDALTERFNL
ncbi:MAG: flagellar protein FliT [Nitrospirales bacterium]|nr:flagellar protein FliT [Nitrospirales bacterium]